MNLLTKLSGAWKQVRRIHIKQAGAWKHVRKVFVKVAGVWKLTYADGVIVSLTTYYWTDSTKRSGPVAAMARIVPSVPLPIQGNLGYISEIQMQEQYDFPVAGQTNTFVFTIVFDNTKPLPIGSNPIRVTNLVTGISLVTYQTAPGDRFWQASVTGTGGYPPPPWGDLIVRNGVTDPFLFEYA